MLKAHSMKWFRQNLVWAIRGVAIVFRTQASARIQAGAAVFAIGAGFFFKIDRIEWLAVTGVIGLVLMAEAFNTSLEALADALHPERHPLIGRAKDMAAGAVFLAAIAATAVGAIVFLPKVLTWLTLPPQNSTLPPN